jgi:hypothetical protein
MKFNSRLCFDHGSSAFKKGRSSGAKFKDSMSSLNEGIADLFSRYILDKKITLKGITCLEQTRDVDSRKFANNAPKVMTQSVFNQFLKPGSPSGINCLRTINFHDPHMVGSIIANTFYELLEKRKLEKKDKLKFLYRYLGKINSQYYNLKKLNPQAALEKMMFLGIELSQSFFDLSKKEKCGFVSRHFPTLHHYYSCK